jgi:cytoskeletal protein CcmA (bactofilin family)
MSFPSTVAEQASPGPVGTASGLSTVIDANTVVDGTLSTSQDLRIEGRVTGSVLCDGVIHVAEGAEVDANVEAAGIVVAGSLSGTIVCHGRLEIRSTGSVRGSVETGRLIVVEGAVYEGQLRMDATIEDEPTAAPEVQQPEDAAPPPPGQATGSYSFLRNFTPGGGSARPADDVLPASPEDEEPE